MNLLMKCGCGKRFPLNPNKHRRDETVYCPWCKRATMNPTYKTMIPRLNVKWLTQKLRAIQDKRQAKRFMEQYDLVQRNPFTLKVEKYLFPLRRWIAGDRPYVALDQVKQIVGPSETAVQAEIDRLYKMRIKVKGVTYNEG